MSEEIIDVEATPVEPAPPQPWYLSATLENGPTVALLMIAPTGEVKIHPDVANQIADAVVAKMLRSDADDFEEQNEAQGEEAGA